jgi:hypothetical protein
VTVSGLLRAYTLGLGVRASHSARLRPSIALPSIIGICASRSLDATQYHVQHASPSSRKSVS